MWFEFSVSSNYFLEIARLRAARLLWQNIVEQYYPAQSKETNSLPASPMYIHAKASSVDKTIYDAYTNVLRNSLQSMAAIVGGVDSFTCLPFDDPLRRSVPLSSAQKGERLAHSAQLIHKHESYLDLVFDPAAGSYYLEKLTDLIAKEAWAAFQKIEKNGGLIEMLRKGQLQAQARKLAEEQLEKAAKRKLTVLGANQFPPPVSKEAIPANPRQRPSPGSITGKAQKKKLSSIKKVSQPFIL